MTLNDTLLSTDAAPPLSLARSVSKHATAAGNVGDGSSGNSSGDSSIEDSGRLYTRWEARFDKSKIHWDKPLPNQCKETPIGDISVHLLMVRILKYSSSSFKFVGMNTSFNVY